MEIIFGRENVEKLRERYTILDLETVQIEPGKTMEVFCLIPGEKIGLADLPQLENWKQLHADFLKGYHNKEYDYCRECIEHLRGHFGGEVDSFYDEILRRINEIEPEKSD